MIYIFLGCFDLLLDAEKCRYGIEIPSTLGASLLASSAMFFGASATPSMSPPRTPWVQCGTPRYFSPSGPSKYFIRMTIPKIIMEYIYVMIFFKFQ